MRLSKAHIVLCLVGGGWLVVVQGSPRSSSGCLLTTSGTTSGRNSNWTYLPSGDFKIRILNDFGTSGRAENDPFPRRNLPKNKKCWECASF